MCRPHRVQVVIDTMTWRPLTLDDVPALTRFWRTIESHDGWPDLSTEDEVREQLVRTTWDMSRDSLAVVTADGTIVGLAVVPPPPPGGHILNPSGGVIPQHRGRGIGRRLISWSHERMTAQRVDAGAGTPWEAHLGAMDSDKDTARLAARFGYVPVRYWYEMDRSVADPIPDLPLPADLRVVTYDPAWNDALYVAHMEAFSDHWGFQRRPKEEFVKRFGTSFRPEQSVLAIAPDDSVAGYLLSGAYSDPTRMTMETIGTRRAWRRRGVASGLIAEALRRYDKAGVTTASLGVDSKNPTGALGVYERLGFAPTLSATTFAREITGD